MAADLSTAPLAILIDLATSRLGGRAIATNDDFFAPMANLVKPDAPQFIPGKFTSRGKWMDGWESRRRRTPGHDWCVVALGVRGIVRSVNVDTSHFTGNYPSHCSIDALDTPKPVTKALSAVTGAPWTTILREARAARQQRQPDADRSGASLDTPTTEHLPGRSRGGAPCYGDAVIDWTRLARQRRVVDLAAVTNGGIVLAASDMHFGAKDNLPMPGRAKNMGDGWETRRRRGPGYDWAIVRLGAPGVIQRIEIDTNHFKGNYPDSASMGGHSCLARRRRTWRLSPGCN